MIFLSPIDPEFLYSILILAYKSKEHGGAHAKKLDRTCHAACDAEADPAFSATGTMAELVGMDWNGSFQLHNCIGRVVFHFSSSAANFVIIIIIIGGGYGCRLSVEPGRRRIEMPSTAGQENNGITQEGGESFVGTFEKGFVAFMLIHTVHS
eukprot:scaffold823_cov219-Amphora_coffeaeformis.AAC.25